MSVEASMSSAGHSWRRWILEACSGSNSSVLGLMQAVKQGILGCLSGSVKKDGKYRDCYRLQRLPSAEFVY